MVLGLARPRGGTMTTGLHEAAGSQADGASVRDRLGDRRVKGLGLLISQESHHAPRRDDSLRRWAVGTAWLTRAAPLPGPVPEGGVWAAVGKWTPSRAPAPASVVRVESVTGTIIFGDGNGTPAELIRQPRSSAALEISGRGRRAGTAYFTAATAQAPAAARPRIWATETSIR
jgi:hypothetical protein